jgi:hypothetical protein
MIKIAIRFLVWLGDKLGDGTYGHHANLLGKGPCQRCVGLQVKGAS